ncbi:hypothetical protein [Yoonia sp. 208BN28-4]|uniref:hypothetical protein n=1 Tax=Yoonia sp. 208BN28-4 TaxID=3126505 RepID=UPI00309CC566
MNFDERERFAVGMQLWVSAVFGAIVLFVGGLVIWLVAASLRQVFPDVAAAWPQDGFASFGQLSADSFWNAVTGEVAIRNSVLIFSAATSLFCLLVFWSRMARRAWIDFWGSALKRFVPIPRDKIRLSRGPELAAMSQQLSEREPFEYQLLLSREKRLFLRGQTIDILPFFREVFIEKSRSLFVFGRIFRILFLAVAAFATVAFMLASFGVSKVEFYAYLAGGALMIVAAILLYFIAGLIRSLLDRNLLLALNSSEARESDVRERESDYPISLPVSAQSLARHIRSKLKAQGVFGRARVSENQKEDGSRSVIDTGDFGISMLVEEDYREADNPYESVGVRRLRIGNALSLSASILLLVLVTPAILSLILSSLSQTGVRYLLSPVIIAIAFPAARYLTELAHGLKIEGRMLLLSDWVETTVTFADFHGDVRSKTTKQLDANGMQGEEEKGQVCSTSFTTVSTTVRFASATADPSAERYPFSYFAGEDHDARTVAVETALREIERFGKGPASEFFAPHEKGDTPSLIEAEQADHKDES